MKYFSLFLLLPTLFAGETQERDALVRAEAFFAARTKQAANLVFTPLAPQSSPAGVHIYYQRQWHGLPVRDVQPRYIHFDHALKVTHYQEAAPLKGLIVFPHDRETLWRTLQKKLISKGDEAAQGQLISASKLIFATENNAIPAMSLRVQVPGSPPALWQFEVDARTGQILERFNHLLTFSGHTGSGLIYRRNPISGALPSAAPEDRFVQVPLPDLDGSGHLRGSYVDVTALAPSSQIFPGYIHDDYKPGAAYSAEGIFNYETDDPAFEEVMVYFWVDQSQRYLQSLGFHILEQPIPVNVHAFQGSNAFYSRVNGGLYFGDDRIEAAEDDGVIRHEYGHAVLDAVVAGRFRDRAGRSFHEGFADFFSYLAGEYANDLVGPNLYPEFGGTWINAARGGSPPYIRAMTQPSFRFPFLTTTSNHTNGRLWSSAFFELSVKLGREHLERILIQALYYMPTGRPGDVAQALWRADQERYAGAGRAAITSALESRGLINQQAKVIPVRPLPGQETLIAPATQEMHFIEIIVPERTTNLSIWAESQVPFTLSMCRDNLPGLLNRDFVTTTTTFQTDIHMGPGSFPALVPGSVYYLALTNPDVVSFRYVLDKPPEPIPLLAVNEKVDFSGSRFFELTSFTDASRLWIQHSDLEAVTISDHHPSRFEEERPEGNLVSYNIFSNITPVMVDLTTLFDNPQHLYLSVASRSGREGSVSWQMVEPYELGRADTMQITLSTDGPALLNVSEPVDGLIFETAATQLISVALPNGLTAYSREKGSVRQVYLLGRGPGLGNRSFTTEAAGEARLILNQGGSATDAIAVTVRRVPFPEPVTLAAGTPVSFTLSQNASIFRLSVPPQHDSLTLTLDTPENESIKLNFARPDGSPSGLTSALGWGSRGGKRQFHATTHNLPNFPFKMEAGEDLHLWLRNDAALDLEASLSYTTYKQEEKPSDPIAESTQVVISADTATFAGMDTAFVKYHLTPPQGTKKVRLELSDVVGIFEPTLWVGDATRGWRALSITQSLDRFNLGQEPDQGFDIFLSRDLRFSPLENPVSFVVRPIYEASPYTGHLAESGAIESVALLGTRDHILLESTPDTRRVDLAITFPQDSGQLSLRVSPGTRPDQRTLFTATIENREGYLNRLPSAGPYLPLAEPNYLLSQQAFSSQQPYTLHARSRFQETETRLALPSRLNTLLVTGKSVRLINAGAETAEFTVQGDEQHNYLLPAGGFADLPTGDAAPRVTGPAMAVFFQQMSGDGWLTLATSAFSGEDALIPAHISPDQSPWQSWLILSSSSDHLDLGGLDLNLTPDEDGLEQAALNNATAAAVHARLSVIPVAGEAFSETSLIAGQYWMNGNQVTAELPSFSAGRSLVVPHLPRAGNGWWSGLSLANLLPRTVGYAVIAYSPAGQRQAEMRTGTLGPLETHVALTESFLPQDVDPATVGWLHIVAESEAIAGLQFMGPLAGGDSAAYTLTPTTGKSLVFPGHNQHTWQGISLVNTVNLAGQVSVQAIGVNGTALAEAIITMAPYERRLLVPAQLFPVLEDFYLRADSETLKLAGVQVAGLPQGGLGAVCGQVLR